MTPSPKIPYSEFSFSFARSSGPGGQNVNKVNSKAILKWNLDESISITEDQRAHLISKLKLNESGEVVVMSDRFRDQGRNKEDCIEKFYALLKKALHVPQKRKKTKKSYSSQLKAKESKKRHSEKKGLRSFRYK
jgi:ribosome-associated protein